MKWICKWVIWKEKNDCDLQLPYFLLLSGWFQTLWNFLISHWSTELTDKRDGTKSERQTNFLIDEEYLKSKKEQSEVWHIVYKL